MFFLMLAGATLANSGRSIIQEFHRSRVYLDIDDQEIADMAGAGSEKPASKDKMAAAKAARS